MRISSSAPPVSRSMPSPPMRTSRPAPPDGAAAAAAAREDVRPVAAEEDVGPAAAGQGVAPTTAVEQRIDGERRLDLVIPLHPERHHAVYGQRVEGVELPVERHLDVAVVEAQADGV